jgi:hypothetical protein
MERMTHPGAVLAEAGGGNAVGRVYARWRTGPTYQLAYLAGDPLEWPHVDIEALELLVFDQCMVFGAAFPGSREELARAARRDKVVRRVRKMAWAVYEAFAARASVDRRLHMLDEVMAGIDAGGGSIGSLVPFCECDADEGVVAAAVAHVAWVADAAPSGHRVRRVLVS